MWFSLGFQNFIAKKSFNVDSCDIFVSDLIRIWHTTLSNQELISVSQVKLVEEHMLNPLLEASVQKLRDIMLNSLEDVKTLKEIKEENNKITLILESDSKGVKFRFKTSLNEGSHEMFYKEFTIPLLKMLINTQKREKKLIKIIEDKDVEITEYKQDLGDVKCYFGTTKPFSKKEFDCEESETSISWDNSFLDSIINQLLTTGKICKIKQMQEEQHASQELKEQYSKAKKVETKSSDFKDKSLNQKTNSKPSVSLDNLTIKRRKHNNLLKLNF